ncbi:hypothetical protein R3P38DRAFT_2804541 [Favolaschia claudopus]|uniref:Uncharacterized protein n=1 Tax=Favolaschia claudopus TaxID=2862362 RepID=A0AAV9ZQ78_9AGAR
MASSFPQIPWDLYPIEDEDEVIESSQPDELEEEEFALETLRLHLKSRIAPSTPSLPRIVNTGTPPLDSPTRVSRRQLVRRASPVKPRPISNAPVGPRSRNLVRRVTKAAELERRRQRARMDALGILKKIRHLDSVANRLRRRYRQLSRFSTQSIVATAL